MSSEGRKSQNILRGLIQNQTATRAESVPRIFNASVSTKNKENHNQRPKSVYGISLQQLGLPRDTFADINLLSDKKEFQKSVDMLNKMFPIYSDVFDVNLDDLKNQMERDLMLYEKEWMKSKIDSQYSVEDQEIMNINDNSTNLDLAKRFRSSSALTSKIPTPIKAPASQRSVSKMELRIQRKLSEDTQRAAPSQLSSELRNLSQRKYSIQGEMVQFDEFF